MNNVAYSMPGQPHRLFLNVVYACPNACTFCVDFVGDTFFGQDLKTGRATTSSELVAAYRQVSDERPISEVYFCGIGEPLLRYDTIVEAARGIRRSGGPALTMALNTSGTFYAFRKQLDFVKYFDLLQVSLNAESAEKYELICRPKIKNSFLTLIQFLRDLRRYLDSSCAQTRVELTIVDTSEGNTMPDYAHLDLGPAPDLDACHRLACELGFPLKVKSLIRDMTTLDVDPIGTYRQ